MTEKLSSARKFSRSPSAANANRQIGISLLELAIVLVIGAILTAGGMDWALSVHSSGSSVGAQSTSDAARAALVSFARTNHRLPCPDVIGDGHEGDCTDVNMRVGWLPVVALGMSDRNAAADTLRRPRYAVYRTAGSDLVRPANAQADTPSQALYFSLTAAASASADPSQPVIARSEAECSSEGANVAFAVQVPFESTDWRPAEANTLCFVSSRPTASETAARLLAEVTRS
ncbi:hypothetical protein DFR41_1085 [Pseudacidovorax intermedius]|uniref:Prepilin-type N-terminal cleavage/methylation domain-containing protein n=1 Tax=Pseudacidovorax intermedius TaxID=433924 RepID=A0A370FER3_9BURK|nr:prepilin-type N-terminal cleavage/methylation domain-containing protein [Pseudacidovorax intermedius]RDI21881.1 hypothetical protein DFR41_1085 [Pseudacidovorax intermedius]